MHIGKRKKMKIPFAYGPVPSRRLGQSIGINHVPPKICTYSCIYCQLGKTINKQVERKKNSIHLKKFTMM
jgi:wyosine [tRNA(Phe)-imidazoG37] synthetase (radical SAM superfamily)